MAAILPDNQVEHWHLLYEEAIADAQYVTQYKELDTLRLDDQKEMVDLLNTYLTGKMTTEEFRATFDRKTRSVWNTFGFKGMSGAGFLNVLVKYIADERRLAEQLRLVLRIPSDTADGREKMKAFLQFLENLISSKQVKKRQIQPARTPFFVSAWWHLQAPEQWPVFYPRTRQLLELEGLYTSSQNPLEDYFTFRECFMSLAAALGLTAWQLEHLSAWYGNEKRGVNGAQADREVVTTTDESAGNIITNANKTIKQHNDEVELEPWIYSLLELMKHAEEHRQANGEFDKRIALIGYDNAIEVSISTYLQLHPTQRGGASYANEQVNKWLANYHSLLDFFFDEFMKTLDQKPPIAKQNVIYYHKLRNDLYHEGKSFVPTERDIENARKAALYIFSTLFKVKGEELIQTLAPLHTTGQRTSKKTEITF